MLTSLTFWTHQREVDFCKYHILSIFYFVRYPNIPKSLKEKKFILTRKEVQETFLLSKKVHIFMSQEGWRGWNQLNYKILFHSSSPCLPINLFCICKRERVSEREREREYVCACVNRKVGIEVVPKKERKVPIVIHAGWRLEWNLRQSFILVFHLKIRKYVLSFSFPLTLVVFKTYLNTVVLLD